MKIRVNLQYDFEYEGFIADCPALPGCMSQGKTRKEALKNIHEAVEGYIEVMKKIITLFLLEQLNQIMWK
ncbi:MAG: type II toxin-antitoxin system HicB family antitoxin [Patescibacteria group bacterium]